MELSFSFEEENRIDEVNFFPISKWIMKEFSQENKDYITNKVGDWSFFKRYEEFGLDKLELLEFLQDSFQGQKDKHIQDIVLDKLKEIAPKEFGCDPELYATSKYYRTWFTLRESFFKQMDEQFEQLDRQENTKYLMWITVLDNYTPHECEKLNNRIFNVDESFKVIANLHWGEVHEFCRCDLRVMNERMLAKRNLKAP